MAEPIHHVTRHCANFCEIDLYGHLNTTHYLQYFINHRFTAMRERFDLSLERIQELEIAFYTREVSITFLRPVFGDQEFTIASHLASADRASCQVACAMNDLEGNVLAQCVFKLVAVDKQTKRPRAWPEGFLDRFYG